MMVLVIAGIIFLYIDLLPYGLSANDISVPRSDDGSSGLIMLQQQFCFYGSNESSIYVSKFTKLYTIIILL